jgi:hypothetical protein
MSSMPSEGDAVADVEPDAEEIRAVEEIDEQASVDVMALLGEHVPLALLADLAEPTGPKSPTILEDEGLPEVAWWEPTDEQAEQDE